MKLQDNTLRNVKSPLQNTKSCRNIHPIISRSNLNNAKANTSMLQTDLDQLQDPNIIHNMDKVVNILLDAIFTKQNIACYSGHNLESITSAASLKETLDQLSTPMEVFFEESYQNSFSIQKETWDSIIQSNVTILIILNNIEIHEEYIKEAIDQGMTIIMIRENQWLSHLMMEITQLTSKQTSQNISTPYLTLNSIILKLTQALHAKMGFHKSMIHPFLDLTAIGLSARYASLINDHRIFMYQGLNRINTKPRIGLKKLIQHYNLRSITARDLVFKINPCLQSSIRLESPNQTLNWLCEKNETNAHQLTQQIIKSNEQRKMIQEKDVRKAMQYIQSFKSKDHCNVLFNEQFNVNLIGIVASKIAQKTNRPTIVMTLDKHGIVVGSGRSIGNYNLFDALVSTKHLLHKYGGHSKAIGFRCDKVNILPFKQLIISIINKTIQMSDAVDTIRPITPIDINDITMKLWMNLRKLEPCGPGNMRPMFTSNIILDGKQIQQFGGKHVKIHLTTKKNQKVILIGYNMGHCFEELSKATSIKCQFVFESYLNRDNKTIICTIRSITNFEF